MKILVVAMTMNSGGAETHIYELMRELKRTGFKLMLVSSGGMLAEKLRLEHPDIIIKEATLDKVSPLLLGSFFSLLKEMVAFKPDLVHTHGRIPSTICGILSAILNIPYVATAHGCYKMFFGAKFLTKWGQKTIAVSEDIKSYLQKNYSLKSKNIFIQKNGIDIQRFNQPSSEEKERIKAQLLESLEIYEDKKIYLTVSRLSHDAYLCTNELLEVAASISNTDERAILLIAGDGELMPMVSQKVAEVNFNLQKDFAICLGHRDDVDIIVKAADVFIGNGRSAIEAAACGCPVIVAGGGAYLGRVNKQNLDECVATNFTTRKRTSFDLAMLIKEITSAKSGGFEAVLAEFIKMHYSITKAINETLNAYNAVMREKGKIKCFVFGYYGCGNFGDDMLLEAMVRNLRQQMPYLNITTTTGKYAIEKLNDIKTINRYNIFSIVKAIITSKICIMGGGELLQDSTSNRSFLYYYLILRMVVVFKKKLVLYSNGIGKIVNERNQKRLNKLNNKIDLVLVRDKASYERFLQLVPDFDRKKIFLTADDCLSLDLMPNSSKQRNKLVIIPKEIPNTNFKIISDVILRFTRLHKLEPVIVVADTKKDFNICKNLSGMINNAKIVKAHSFDELHALMSESVIAVTSRLHGLIFASMAGAFPVVISDENKLTEYMMSLGQEEFIISGSEITSELLFMSLSDALKSRIENREVVEAKIDELAKSAFNNARLTADLIKDVYNL